MHLQRLVLRQQLEAHARRHTSPLLDTAGRLLERLTAGRWVALHANDDGDGHRFLDVVRADATPLRAAALSEGTADQVFLALRLAGIIQQQAERWARGWVPLPVVFDDVLMTFDDGRAGRALQVLADIAAGAAAGVAAAMQVILFTHHDHLAGLAEDLRRDDITVARLEPTAVSGLRAPEEVRSAVRQWRATPPATGAPVVQQPAALAETGARAGHDVDPAQVRAWARANSIQVADRGRIREEIVAQYRAANGQ